ncbi:tyrosine-type recombinase/integrase [Pelomonas sp. V22]|uniref:site-specific integrase n=1 Tax=Pelomonas sp. V22 TaxID=2822139 RepID=UPI0024A8A3B5|nr:site-specific integrase [Pelomonas sp. V22]MDI4635523.1 tyrosine-type recombinase/integrase [Pelomonas sp. V22]
MKLKSLTQEFVDGKLICPAGERSIEFCCPIVRGMYIRVAETKPGEGIYYLRYKSPDKKTKHERLGRTGEVSLAEAREAAKRFKAELELGMHRPAPAVVVTSVEPPTLKAFFSSKFLPYIKPRKRSWRRDEELFRLRILPRFGSIRIDQISRHEVQSYHGTLRENGLSPATSDHVLKVFRHSLNLAVEWDLIERNPLARVRLFNEDNRMENVLSKVQLDALIEVLESDDNRPACLIAQFLLCTGARLNEALSAQWEHIDLEKRHWLIPAKNSKSKRPRPVPLNESALHVLGQLPTRGEKGHLFINRQTGKPYTTLMKVWDRLRKKAGLPHLRIHDLRHNYASMLVNAGRTLYEVQKILGHSTAAVTERYSHLSSETLQAAANKASVLDAKAIPLPKAA